MFEKVSDIDELYCNWGIRSFQKVVKGDKGPERGYPRETEYESSRNKGPTFHPREEEHILTSVPVHILLTPLEMMMWYRLPNSVLKISVSKIYFLMLATGYKLSVIR